MKFKDWDKRKIDEQIDEQMGFVQKLPYQTKKEKAPKKSDITREVEKPMDIKKAVEKYTKGVQERITKDYKTTSPNITPPNITYKKGGRYYKVIRKETFGTGQSVHSFIDSKEGPTFGNVYKAASWRAPAKGARGNVFSPTNGLEAVTGTGTVWYAKTGRR